MALLFLMVQRVTCLLVHLLNVAWRVRVPSGLPGATTYDAPAPAATGVRHSPRPTPSEVTPMLSMAQWL